MSTGHDQSGEEGTTGLPGKLVLRLKGYTMGARTKRPQEAKTPHPREN